MAHLNTKQLIILVPQLLLLTAIVSEAITIGSASSSSSSSSCKGKLNLCKNMEPTADCDKVCPPGAQQKTSCTVECNSCQLVCIMEDGSAQQGINRREMQEKGDSSAVVGSSEGGKKLKTSKGKGKGKGKVKKEKKGKGGQDAKDKEDKKEAKEEADKKGGTGDKHPE